MNNLDDEFEDDFEGEDFSDENHKLQPKIVIIIGLAGLIVVLILFFVMKTVMNHIKEEEEAAYHVETVAGQEIKEMDTDDGFTETAVPLSDIGTESQETLEETLPEVNILTCGDVPEVEGVFYGIDVSKYQGVINWERVAQSGIDFAMIRVGLRTLDTGEIKEDEFARYNLQEATANGIKVGVYFFSTAITEEEAILEAQWTVSLIEKYNITYPVGYNCEGYSDGSNRQYQLSKEERTKCAEAFLNKVYEAGYTPVFYASKNEMSGNRDWITDELERSYKIWVSWYSESQLSLTGRPDYEGSFSIWQYTSEGSVDGIIPSVDKDVAYFGYESVASAHDATPPAHVDPDYEAMYHFVETQATTVTAKEETNLRNIPDQGLSSTVMYTLRNGEIATVTAVSDSGWSRVIFNGNTYYAITNFLTTEIGGQQMASDPVVQEAVVDNSVTSEGTTDGNGGIKTVFTDCYEQVTPKIEINLRLLPSVTDPGASIVATPKNGEVFIRTGINSDVGWSRVEYNGQVLYCVSSYLSVVQ